MNKQIQDAWDTNAEAWIKAVQGNKIASRKYTNKAILTVLSELNGNRFLDCGCGEGWLSSALSNHGKIVTGFDGTEKFILKAKETQKGTFYKLNYEEISDGKNIPGGPFDTAIFNFSLYEEKGLELLLNQINTHLIPEGHIVIQTLSPIFIFENGNDYISQWFENSWLGLPDNFSGGHPWYARTFEDWIKTFTLSNLTVIKVEEVLNDQSKPVSIIFVLKSA